ncbi:auxin-responsive IAA4-like [Olea europaea subsp. europaea]|uniref:Auxin-responsive protein n=1 Tax=Olea europaea subsp. europaea TaxID=158383 RepID=A0A8S0QZP3_OLEEU|nr:auxin-responsive IAA4-like [Olea europaea subsp. europaea]
MAQENHLNLKETELRLGLPGTDESDDMICSARNNKRAAPESVDDSVPKANSTEKSSEHETSSASKAQIVGWPPVRSYWKNNFQPKKVESETRMYVKVSMDGAPYLRKVDLKVYNGYPELLKALENMFKVSIGEYSESEGYKGSQYAPAYEDKDGDLMLVGDVPWE